MQVDVPPPWLGGGAADCLVPRPRFDAAAAATHPPGQHVTVFLLADAARRAAGRVEGFSGTVVADKLGGQLPEDACSCEELVGRYQVRQCFGSLMFVAQCATWSLCRSRCFQQMWGIQWCTHISAV